MAKRVSARRIKLNRQYTYDEAARELGVTPQTVRAWRAQGLSVLDDQVPHLIIGCVLKDFVETRQPKPQRLGIGEFLCMGRCQAPTRPYGRMADYIAFDGERGRLEALCERCETRCSRLVRASALPEWRLILDVAMCGAGKG